MYLLVPTTLVCDSQSLTKIVDLPLKVPSQLLYDTGLVVLQVKGVECADKKR